MEHTLAETGLRLRYLRDAQLIANIDQGRILEDLAGGGIDDIALPWRGDFDLSGKDHVVLATLGSDGRHVGLLTARDFATPREPFLLFDAAYVAPAARGHNLLQRMITFAVLRIGAIDMVPRVLVACSQSAACRRGLGELTQHFTGSKRFPAVDTTVVDLDMAALARRIARVVRPGLAYAAGSGMFYRPMLAGAVVAGGVTRFGRYTAAGAEDGAQALMVLDFAGADDDTILQDARRLYRARSRRRNPRLEFVDGAAATPAFVRHPVRDATKR
jgi:hypothetical protein